MLRHYQDSLTRTKEIKSHHYNPKLVFDPETCRCQVSFWNNQATLSGKFRQVPHCELWLNGGTASRHQPRARRPAGYPSVDLVTKLQRCNVSKFPWLSESLEMWGFLFSSLSHLINRLLSIQFPDHFYWLHAPHNGSFSHLLSSWN
jgi:hypothetical protein